MCIAKQNLVIRIDGSGSVRKDDFKILVRHTETLLKRYRTEYPGQKAIRIGVALFGNGMIMTDGKTANVNFKLTKIPKWLMLKQQLLELHFKKGFTNMAQVLLSFSAIFVTDIGDEANFFGLLMIKNDVNMKEGLVLRRVLSWTSTARTCSS